MKEVGIHDNFFDLGGHSLKATLLVSRMYKQLDIQVQLRDVFRYPTIEALDAAMQEMQAVAYLAIKPAEPRETYPVTSQQKRLYVLQQLEGAETSYNMPAVLEVQGSMDRQRFEQALNALAARHEALRTSFELLGGEAVQRIHPSVELSVRYMQASEAEAAEQIAEFVRAFDISQAPLMRVGLMTLTEDRHLLLFDMHHIISDGMTLNVLIGDWLRLYEGQTLSPLKLQYKDYACWQQELAEQGALQKQEAYWMEQLSGELPLLDVPVDFARPSIRSFEGDSVRFTLDKLLTEQLTKLAKESGATLYMVLLAAYTAFLSRLSGQEEVLVGSPIAGRPHAELEPIAGMFVNTLVLRTRPEKQLTFADYVQEVKQMALAAFEHQDYPFELLVDKVATRRDLSRNPLFDAMFVLQNMELQQLQTTEFHLKETTYTHQVSKFDLTLTVTQKQDELDCTFEYSTALFQRDTIERWAGHFMTLVQSVTLHPRLTLDSAKLMSDQDIEQVIEEFNDTAAEFQQGKMIHHLFEEQAARTPERLAVIHEHTQLTYRELNERANRLAWTLRQKGIGANDVVGVCTERSPHMLAGILAILKAGGAYVPMTPDLPEGRLAYMLADSGAKLVLTERRLAEKLGSEAPDILCLDEESAYAEDSSNLPETADGINDRSLAYIIYTSGSTGQPKGVMVEHASVVNLLYALQAEYPLQSEDRFLLKTTFTFDVSVPELFGGFLTGAALVILPDGQEKDPEAIAHTIQQHSVTHINFVPSMLRAFLQVQPGGWMSGLKYVFAAGEALAPDLVQSFYTQMDGAELINIYGPTEGTVYATGERLRADTSMVRVPIGRPLANVRAYVIDTAGHLQPVGIAGELCLAGAGLARGYVNQPELTAEKFTRSLVTGERMYRTGDLVRWLADGSIEYLGRMDHQVKIRGYRIELGEIEAALLQLEAVREATVIDREEGGERILCAYVTASRELTVSGLRAELSQSLPSYMIPAAFVQLERLPLTTSGKIDRKALPAPDESSLNTGVTYVAPVTPLQAKLSDIWQDVLSVKQVGIHDSFFDLGGHSLKATQLISKMHKQLEVQVPLRDVFRYPTIEALAAAMQEMQVSAYTAIKPAEPRETYPVTSQQKRLYVLQQLEGAETSYNMPAVLEVQGSIDRQRFEQALNALVERHEALRTSFELVDGEAVQRIHPTVELSVRYMQTSEEEVAEQITSFVRAFDISQAPLMRVGLMTLTQDRHLLLFDMHHIISDGMTLNLLISDWLRLYEGQTLSPLKLQYKDYACWQRELEEQGALQKQEAYWLEQLSGELPLLDVPIDHPRPSIRSFEGDSVRFTVDKLLTGQLTKLAKESGATLYMVLFAAYTAFLSRLSGQEEMLVGSPIAGRPHADLEPIAGMFVNTLVLRTRPEKQLTFADYVQEVKQVALAAFEHQDYPFELLVDKVATHRDLSRNPLFDAMFVLQNMELQQQFHTADFRLIERAYSHQVSKFDLTLSIIEVDNQFDCTFEYSTALFQRETMERWADYFVRVLRTLVEHPNTSLASINLLSEKEQNQLLTAHNSTWTDYPRNQTLHALFEERAASGPERTALIFEDTSLTYRELNAKANQLAHILRRKGVQADDTVGLLTDRSPEMIIGILAILKAGGAYVPLDPENPASRIRYILEDSGATMLLTRSQLFDLAEEAFSSREILSLDDHHAWIHEKDCNLEPNNTANHLAYVMYTSGTTGQPKGILTTHANISRVIMCTNYIEISEDDVLLGISNYVFDGSTFDIYGALLNGASLVLASKERVLDIPRLPKFVHEHGITVFFSPTALFNALMDTDIHDLRDVRTIVIGGEKASVNHVRKAIETLGPGSVINGYGPTETTVFATAYQAHQIIDGASAIPIGKPLSNTMSYILNPCGLLQPIGVPGELYIGGEGVARGYLNLPELTAEKFVDNPFQPGGKMYRTGDMARWKKDGTIEYLGRLDHQVKIRGYRIELGEVEAKLMKQASVRDAVVLDLENGSGERYLCAYVTADRALVASELRTELRTELLKSLPHFMVPAVFVQLEHIPLTANGKTDRKALPAPDDGNLGNPLTYTAPTTKLQAQLAEIWQEVLEVRQVGIHDHFFEHGGHSLKATLLAARIHKHLGIQVPLRDVFRYPTIHELACTMEEMNVSIYAEIPQAEALDLYPVTSQQKRLYVLEQLSDAGTSYNMPIVMSLEGKVDRERFAQAFHQLAARHESLRTSFELRDGEPMQRIHADLKLDVNFLLADEIEAATAIAGFARSFNLSQAPLVRVGLITITEDRHLLLFDMHHIVSDGLTLKLLIRDWLRLYEGQELSPMKLQYKDYACWQQELMQKGTLKQQEAYWLEQLSGELPLLELPADWSRPPVRSFEGDRVSVTLNESLTCELNKLAKETGTTLYMLLLAAYSALLSRLSGQEEIIVGSPIAGRPHADLEPIAGMLVNTLVMRTYPEGKRSFMAYLQDVKQAALAAYEHQDYPFELVVEKAAINRDMSRNPLFDTMFMLQHKEQEHFQTTDFLLSERPHTHQISKFDLSLTAAEMNNEMECTFEYATALFKSETIERWAAHWVSLLQSAVLNPHLLLESLELMSGEEKAKQLRFNDTEAHFPQGVMVHQLLEQQAERTPDRVAVIDTNRQITFRELNERANSLAHTLRLKGIEQEAAVGLMTSRSLDMLVGILGIMKAGGAYVPITPELPKERIAYMLGDSGTKLVLAESRFADQLGSALEVLHLDEKDAYSKETSNLPTAPDCAKNLAYILYTSGSTGQPKGVMVEHASVVNVLYALQEQYPLQPEDRFLLKTTFTFDVSVPELFGGFLTGAALVILPDGQEKDPEAIAQTILQYDVTHINFVPSMLRAFLQTQSVSSEAGGFPVLKYVFTAGEAIAPELVQSFYSRMNGQQLINLYGPTEGTVYATGELLLANDNAERILIGRPLPNVKAYVVSRSGSMQPIGVVGELCLGGVGLARGYVNQAELTAQKFVEGMAFTDERLYRTGDLVKWLPDGRIAYYGRMDQQVKIRGYRIEIGEIEAALLEIEDISEVVITDRCDESGERYLCAYVTAKRECTAFELRAELLKELPSYMIPAVFVQLAYIPLTANGKIDRKALPAPADISLNSGLTYTAPSTPLQAQLVNIWQDVLGVKQVGIRDHFFDLGGHSLKAILLASRIHKQLDIQVSLREVFLYPTIEELASALGRMNTDVYAEIRVALALERDAYPVTSQQKRLYVLQQLEETKTSYNMPAVMEVQGSLDRERLGKAFQELVNRHEVLRTSFELVQGEIVQRIQPSVDFQVSYMLAGEEEADGLIAGFMRPFDLRQAPLLRAGLITLADEHHLLLFDMHHIISDGLTQNLLIDEWVQLYEGKELPPLILQYKDYACWQQELAKQGVLEQQEAYWLEQLSGELPQLELPADFARPAVRSFEGDIVYFKLDPVWSGRLNKLAKETEATLFMVLTAMYTVFLSRITGQEDICVGTPVAGRTHADLERIMGMFVNTLVLRNYPKGEKTFLAFLAEVKQRTIELSEHQDYPFEELLEKLAIRRDISRNPLFDAMFTMQPDPFAIKASGLRIAPYVFERKTSKFDFTLEASEGKEGLSFSLEYRSALFKRETMERMTGHLKQLLMSLVSNPNARLDELELLSLDEQQFMLQEFNHTKAEYPREKAVHQLFEEQVARTPERVAVVFEEQQWTYRELNAKANQLARLLKAKGVQQDQIVGVLLERSPKMIVGILAILKAGGAYVPMTPDLPEGRLAYMLADSGAKLVLTERRLAEKLGSEAPAILCLDEESAYADDSSNLPETAAGVNERALAYIIYTSGSTGQPKGVMVEHASVVNLLYALQAEYPLQPEDRFLLKTTFTFDVSVPELFSGFLTGAALVILPDGQEKDPEAIAHTIREHNVTHINFVPSMLRAFLQMQPGGSMSGLKYVFAAGEALAPDLVQSFYRQMKGTELINVYGPTEGTVYATGERLRADQSMVRVPIGRPLSNVRAYVIDAAGNLQPVGIAGELCLAGAGLARGYVKQPELTAEKFTPSLVTGERMYRTGDLVRWLPDGRIEYLGRMDHQVKIRGYRIELGEIEAALLQLEAVREATVIDREEGGERILCAYVTASRELTVSGLRAELSQSLPSYMIPAAFVQLERLPLTSSGKIDRKSLPAPIESSLSTGVTYAAPETPLQEELAAIWQDVLGVKQVGIHDNFFDLGGDSIKALQIASRLYQQHMEVSVRDLLQHPTVKELSPFVRVATRQVDQRAVTGQADLHPIQSWFFEQQFTEQQHYNQAFILFRQDGFDEAKIIHVFDRIVEHHDALRMVYKQENGSWLQTNRDTDGEFFQWHKYDWRDEPDDEKRIKDEEYKIQSKMNLEKGPLMQVALFQTDSGDHLLIAIHHLVVDGVSWRILMEDFAAGYAQCEQGQEISFPAKTHSYLTYTKQLLSYAKERDWASERDYWSKVKEAAVSTLPRDFSVEGREWSDSRMVQMTLTEQETGQLLKQVHRAFNMEINDILLTALGLSLHQWTGAAKKVIALEGHGREPISDDCDISRTVGWFTSLFPVIVDVSAYAKSSDEDGLISAMKSMKDSLRRIPQKGLGYGVMQYMAGDQHPDTVRLKPEICFNYLGQMDQPTAKQPFEISHIPSLAMNSRQNDRPYALDFSAMVTGGVFMLQVHYNRNEYTEDTVIQIIDWIKIYLLQMIELCVRVENTEKTLTDYSDEQLTQEALDSIADMIELL
ncbi:amino acid adenylation domain-containing protein [Paenibacillus sp. 5J-6]|uniref:Amino acid adenylation domain-containing protein n=1 Tax=Paenibacillus silvestris TaxID=2606219 RepID=A0A6L8URK8_9BACL|nr:amino acid adenylation domain-containing protein [Paenibacillus silvestris]